MKRPFSWISLVVIVLFSAHRLSAQTCPPPINEHATEQELAQWQAAATAWQNSSREEALEKSFHNIESCVQRHPILESCARRMLDFRGIIGSSTKKWHEYFGGHEAELEPRIGVSSLPNLFNNKDFLNKVSDISLRDPNSFAPVQAVLEAINQSAPENAHWSATGFEALVTAFDGTGNGRLLISIPRQYFQHLNEQSEGHHQVRDLYIQMTVRGGQGGDPTTRGAQFSVVSVGPCQGEPERECSHIVDLYRYKGKLINIKGSNGANGERCSNCHSNGPIAIKPVSNPFQFPDGATESINQRMSGRAGGAGGGAQAAGRAHGPVEVAWAPKPPVDFPEFGVGRSEEVSALLLKCAAGNTEAERREIRTAMNCKGCHNGSTRNKISGDPFTSPQFLKTLITSGRMPPHGGSVNRLSPEIRTKVDECLSEDYKQKLKKYFSDIPCRAPTPAACVNSRPDLDALQRQSRDALDILNFLGF